MEIKNALDDEKILIAGVIGAISTIAAEIISRILIYLGVGKYSIYQFNSLVITINRPSISIGLILNFIIGSILGATTYLILKKWGHKYTVIMSLMFSLITCIVLEILFTLSIEGNQISVRPIGNYYNHFINSAVYGVTVGFLIKRFTFHKT